MYNCLYTQEIHLSNWCGNLKHILLILNKESIKLLGVYYVSQRELITKGIVTKYQLSTTNCLRIVSKVKFIFYFTILINTVWQVNTRDWYLFNCVIFWDTQNYFILLYSEEYICWIFFTFLCTYDIHTVIYMCKKMFIVNLRNVSILPSIY